MRQEPALNTHVGVFVSARIQSGPELGPGEEMHVRGLKKLYRYCRLLYVDCPAGRLGGWAKESWLQRRLKSVGPLAISVAVVSCPIVRLFAATLVVCQCNALLKSAVQVCRARQCSTGAKGQYAIFTEPVCRLAQI